MDRASANFPLLPPPSLISHPRFLSALAARAGLAKKNRGGEQRGTEGWRERNGGRELERWWDIKTKKSSILYSIYTVYTSTESTTDTAVILPFFWTVTETRLVLQFTSTKYCFATALCQGPLLRLQFPQLFTTPTTIF